MLNSAKEGADKEKSAKGGANKKEFAKGGADKEESAIIALKAYLLRSLSFCFLASILSSYLRLQ